MQDILDTFRVISMDFIEGRKGNLQFSFQRFPLQVFSGKILANDEDNPDLCFSVDTFLSK